RRGRVAEAQPAAHVRRESHAVAGRRDRWCDRGVARGLRSRVVSRDDHTQRKNDGEDEKMAGTCGNRTHPGRARRPTEGFEVLEVHQNPSAPTCESAWPPQDTVSDETPSSVSRCRREIASFECGASNYGRFLAYRHTRR